MTKLTQRGLLEPPCLSLSIILGYVLNRVNERMKIQMHLMNKDRKRLEKLFDSGRRTAGDEETLEAAGRAGEKINHLEAHGIPAALEKFWEDIKILYAMLSDSVKGRYKVPLRTLGAVVFTLLYFVNPFDIIPDLIPLIGYIDDAFVLSLCIKFIGTDLKEYRLWKESKGTIEQTGN